MQTGNHSQSPLSGDGFALAIARLVEEFIFGEVFRLFFARRR